MKYSKIEYATFLNRPNRFIAKVMMNGKEETVHVKNTGRCKNILHPGVTVALEPSGNPERKTKYDLIAVEDEQLGWVNMDSLAPNKIVKEWLESSSFFEGITYLKPEYTYGKSRIDFYVECGERKILMEVKGVTYEKDGVAYFPDAPTERGIKHVEELEQALEKGYETYIAFVIPMAGIDQVRPNREIHPEFADAFEKAHAAGVKVLSLGCEVAPDSIEITRWELS